ncbi:hypothetical protein GCM10020367_63480 [Streptomyces sannanensis]|uniref:Uncharacterized protein n=1 Tax=Streptomyces sannanensis TaxID=285536 RepID=A0ABP6SLY0_9ACTN
MRGRFRAQYTGQGGAQPLAAREHPDGQVGAGTPEEETGEQVHPLGLRPLRGVLGEVLGDRAVQVQRVEALREVGDAPVGPLDRALERGHDRVPRGVSGRLPAQACDALAVGPRR